MKTYLISKAEIIEPGSEEFKSIASSLEKKYGFELKPQIDLLYTKVCLVSAGDKIGVNDNDDVFTREEAWAARQTPIIKPMNWEHNDKDILGVMYNVEARSKDGTQLDINDENVPDCEFDLFVEAAVFKLVHEARVSEIQKRATANQLFVSMEAWFDNYHYGFCDSNGILSKVIARNKTTAFLDKHLRINKGSGKYIDPETSKEVRVARVLENITFGGCAFVERPANKRSIIEWIGEQSVGTKDPVEVLLEKVMEVSHMSQTQASQNDVAEAINAALDQREKVAAAEKERQSLVSRAELAEKSARELEAKLADISSANKTKESELANLRAQLSQYESVVNKFVQASAPEEIARIDAASTGEAAFKAKINWIEKSMSGLKEQAKSVASLEKELATIKAEARKQEIENLLGKVVSKETLETFTSYAMSLDEASYERWRNEKEVMVIELTSKGGQKVISEENAFQTLLAQKRSGATYPGTPTQTELINHPGSNELKSGVSPQSLKNPRYKIAGGLEFNVQEDPELVGASLGDEGNQVNPFRVLASLVTGYEEEKKVEKPSFDPVQ